LACAAGFPPGPVWTDSQALFRLHWVQAPALRSDLAALFAVGLRRLPHGRQTSRALNCVNNQQQPGDRAEPTRTGLFRKVSR